MDDFDHRLDSNQENELENSLESSGRVQDGVLSYQGTTQEVIERYSHCILCGSHLHFTHSTDFGQNLTRETAKCPECGIRVSQVVHRLQ